jgi:hypothetical protein
MVMKFVMEFISVFKRKSRRSKSYLDIIHNYWSVASHRNKIDNSLHLNVEHSGTLFASGALTLKEIKEGVINHTHYKILYKDQDVIY